MIINHARRPVVEFDRTPFSSTCWRCVAESSILVWASTAIVRLSDGCTQFIERSINYRCNTWRRARSRLMWSDWHSDDWMTWYETDLRRLVSRKTNDRLHALQHTTMTNDWRQRTLLPEQWWATSTNSRQRWDWLNTVPSLSSQANF